MKNVEDLYPLSPMQQLMLLHSLTSPGEDVLFNQFRYTIRGDLDADAFRAAWQQIVERHTILRTAFVWKDLDEPLQAVRRTVDVPFEQLDWRGVPTDEQLARFESLCAADAEQGFVPSRAPLLRVKLVRLAIDVHRMIWSSHHLIVDRWCIPIILEPLFAIHDALREGRALPDGPRSRYRDYVAWIQRQDPAAAREFWSAALAGLGAPPLLADGERNEPTRGDLELPAPLAERARAFARKQGLTLGTLFQGAWALVLNRLTGSRDVIFGSVAAGRPPELPDVEFLVGTFVNNVPVRVGMPGDSSVADWLKEIQAKRQARAPFEHFSAAEIQAWAGLPPDRPLFDSLVVSLARTDPPAPGGLAIEADRGSVRTPYPVTLSIDEGDAGVVVRLDCAAGPDAATTLGHLQACLEQLVQSGERRLADLAGFVDRSAEAGAGSPTATAWAGLAVGLSAPTAQGRERLEQESQQKLLLDEMRAILGTDELAPDDDFFEAGGDSLRAVRFHQRAVSLTGVSIPLLSLFAEPTARGMAKTLHDRTWPLHAGIVRPVRTSGSKPPLFCIASPEVNAIGYVTLARHLDAEQPVYVLQAPPDTNGVRRLAPSELPGMAARYVEALQEIDSERPVHLLGMCLGAHIAFEMARQLRADGREVPFLGFVNSWALYTLSWRFHVQRAVNRAHWYVGRLRDLSRQNPREQLATIRARFGRRTPQPAAAGGDIAIAEQEADHRSSEWFEVDWPSRAEPRPKYPGTVTLFRIRRQTPIRIRDRLMGWANHAAHVELRRLSGNDHFGILREPDVAELADRLAECLASESNA